MFNNQTPINFPLSNQQNFKFFFLKFFIEKEVLQYILLRKFQIFTTLPEIQILNNSKIKTNFYFVEPFSFAFNRFKFQSKQRFFDFVIFQITKKQTLLYKQKKTNFSTYNLYPRVSILQNYFFQKLAFFSVFFKFRFWSFEFSRTLFLLFFLSLITKNVNLIGLFCSFVFERILSSQHHSFLSFIESFFISFSTSFRRFFFNQVLGFAFMVKGRLQGSDRTKTRKLIIGKTSKTYKNQKISFCFSPAHSAYGVFGIKCCFFLPLRLKKRKKKRSIKGCFSLPLFRYSLAVPLILEYFRR